MAKTSAIEWTDATFNPWIGCTKVGPGCDHCYAAVSRPAQAMKIAWGSDQPRHRTSTGNWHQPVRWNAAHDGFFKLNGRRRRVFCASLADVFDNEVDPEWRAGLLDLITATPALDWLLLTKRIGNVRTMLDTACEARIGNGWIASEWPNVWLGATVVNQDEADRDVQKLLDVPARVHFVSIEPMLGPIDLTRIVYPKFKQRDDLDPYLAFDALRGHMIGPDDVGLPRLDWVIAGGESGTDARPMSIRWAREVRDQCAAAGVPFLFKQWGEWAPAGMRPSGAPGKFAFGDYEHDRALMVQTEGYPPSFTKFGARSTMERVGKKAAGRRLDGVTHDAHPSP